MKLFRAAATEAIRVAGIMGAGDFFAQTLVERRDLRDVNKTRMLKFAGIGLFVVGPAMRTWYNFMEHIISKNQPQWKIAMKKTAMDQLLFAPTFMLIVTYVVGLVNGESLDIVRKRVRSYYFTLMTCNYMVWPATQMVNFTFVPVQYQVIFVQCVAIIWNMFISNVLNLKMD